MIKLPICPKIIVLTGNENKFNEISRILNRYAIKTIQNTTTNFDFNFIEELLKDKNIISVFRETSCLLDENGIIKNPFLSQNHLKSVTNQGKLIAYNRVNNEFGLSQFNIENFEYNIQGFIDLSNNTETPDNVFDWDNIFRVLSTGLTYQESKERGLKNSVRDEVISQWIINNLYYEDTQLYSWEKYKKNTTIDFDNSLIDFVYSNPYIKYASNSIINSINGILNDGLFFRHSINRRQKNYWLPGQNAGVPRTSKKDPIHEITFTLHDIFHHTPSLLDLVFTGSELSKSSLGKNIYCVHRMCGEAFSLVMADMLFIDDMAKSGIEYDYNKRQIYPLYQVIHLEEKSSFSETIKPLIYANIIYAITGNDQEFYKIKKQNVTEELFNNALQSYKEKYEKYFCVDWQWTLNNYNCMFEKAKYFQDWYNNLGTDIFEKANLTTLDEFINCLNSTNKCDNLLSTVDAVFEILFKNISLFMNKEHILLSTNVIKSNAFRRYMIGQSMLFTVWDFLPKIKYTGKAIIHALKSNELNSDTIQYIINLYNSQLDFLYNQGVINNDDLLTWKGIYPLFEPNYVFYDRKDTPKQLKLVSENCFTPLYPVQSIVENINNIPFIDQEKLWDVLKPIKIENRISGIIASSNGVFFDKEQQLVAKPGVAVLNIGGFSCKNINVKNIRKQLKTSMGCAASWTYLNPKNHKLDFLFDKVVEKKEYSIAHTSSITILVAGVSSLVENEFNSQRDIIHLARITEARTLAQSNPPSVVLYPEILPVIQNMQVVAKEEAKKAFSLLSNFKLSDRLESANSVFSANKAGVFAITGSFRDFQKLVNGLNDNGKEEEYKRVLYIINNILFNLMPDLFMESDYYNFKLPKHLMET